jgi:hypothetical protein
MAYTAANVASIRRVTFVLGGAVPNSFVVPAALVSSSWKMVETTIANQHAASILSFGKS